MIGVLGHEVFYGTSAGAAILLVIAFVIDHPIHEFGDTEANGPKRDDPEFFNFEFAMTGAAALVICLLVLADFIGDGAGYRWAVFALVLAQVGGLLGSREGLGTGSPKPSALQPESAPASSNAHGEPGRRVS